jgi:hypothetical protein
MKCTPPTRWALRFVAFCLFAGSTANARAQNSRALSLASSSPRPDLAQLVTTLLAKSQALQNSSGMRLAFQSFTAAHGLSPGNVRYSDFVMVRLLYEATRDAGFWNMHWEITNQPPNSDNVWRQWQGVRKPSLLAPTAIAECDELSALYAFLAEREGVKGVGLFWPYPNHTVAVWTLHPATGAAIRVVVPTSQIFLQDTDDFDTRTFNPWSQKTIYEYTRRDVPDTFEIPKSLFDLFVLQVDRYAGASDGTLQQIRYLREGVFLRSWSPEQAAHSADKKRTALGSAAPAEDAAAFWNFAADMRSVPSPR